MVFSSQLTKQQQRNNNNSLIKWANYPIKFTRKSLRIPESPWFKTTVIILILILMFHTTQEKKHLKIKQLRKISNHKNLHLPLLLFLKRDWNRLLIYKTNQLIVLKKINLKFQHLEHQRNLWKIKRRNNKITYRQLDHVQLEPHPVRKVLKSPKMKETAVKKIWRVWNLKLSQWLTLMKVNLKLKQQLLLNNLKSLILVKINQKQYRRRQSRLLLCVQLQIKRLSLNLL